jgi:ribosomal protein S18 acetylase RimI-like enzyme
MHTAEVKRLRVEPVHHHRGVGSRLMSVALDFCRELGYLKVVLDTRVERTQAIALFERFGFQLTRTRDVEGKQIHDFYLDLYRQRPEPERDSSHDEVQRQAAEQTHSKTQM